MNHSIRRRARSLIAGALALAAFSLPSSRAAEPADPADPLAWPAVATETKPWTRWWWLGSAVDKPNITRLLEEYQKAGIGGVEICPIYGAKGAEGRFINFLSPQWVEMLAHTTTEARRLGMGVDLTDGTGWPFGGPGVSADDASARVTLKRFDAPGGEAFKAQLPEGKLRALVAVPDQGEQIDLTAQAKAGRIEWAAPAGRWRVYAVVESGPVQKVKRAAPGGEGNVLDPYSVTALDHYLSAFDKALADFKAPLPRGHFHDSFEYYGATWTDDLFAEFQKRRGYDLRAHLPALFGEGVPETVARVKCDYRETVSDLHLAYVTRWTEWAHGKGGVSRNQAHGAPGNLIDLYAAVDIPETEIFARFEERHVPMLKFSSSAAHLGGRRLASAESFTWLGEHFQVPLSQVKPAADFLFLSGVNHVFFHGIPYSPEDAGWPGWLFYASVNFGPNGGLWHDLPAFNAYATRCQSILQAGRPANDVLLYYPFYDLWQTPAGVLTLFTTPGEWMMSHPVHAAAMKLWDRGYGYDEVSDRFLAEAKGADGGITVGGNAYRAVVVPKSKLMPPATLRKLIELAEAGAAVVVDGGIPADVPGFHDLDRRRAELKQLTDSLSFAGDAGAAVRVAKVGKGTILVGSDIDAMLKQAGVAREPMIDSGLRFVRRTHGEGYNYFLVNRGDRPVEKWIPLGTKARSAVLLDPRFADAAGAARLRPAAGGGAAFYLQLQPGESRVLRTFTGRDVGGKPWPYLRPEGDDQELAGEWKVQFVEGGPALPGNFSTPKLASWTDRDDAEAKRFAGTARYTLDFDRPAGEADEWLLDLGRVYESARVKLNGRDLGTLWCYPFRLPAGAALRPGRNTLEVEVTNVAANRIADLDRRGVNWKAFHEINFVNRDYRPFDASKWPIWDSGLLGPVKLVPAKKMTVE